VIKQLKEWGIYEENLGVEKAQERYVRFMGVTFGIAPEKYWPSLRRDLLEFEEGLACR
jgi:hypothetical protein